MLISLINSKVVRLLLLSRPKRYLIFDYDEILIVVLG